MTDVQAYIGLQQVHNQWVKTKETAQNNPLPFPIAYSTDFIAGVACFNDDPTSYAPWIKIKNKASYFAGLSGDWSPYYVNKEITCIFVGIQPMGNIQRKSSGRILYNFLHRNIWHCNYDEG